MKKNDYELYKIACSSLYLYIKFSPTSYEDIACFALYDLLTNTKSKRFFVRVKEIVNSDDGATYADMLVYCLLLSVRSHSDIVTAYLLNICDEILNMFEQEEKSEKRE